MKENNVFLQLIEMKDLSPSERSVVNYLLEHTENLSSDGIVEIGAKSYTSASTVMRVCKKFDCNGFTEFKSKLLKDVDEFLEYKVLFKKKEQIKIDDPISIIIDKVINNSIAAIESVKQLNSDKQFNKAIQLMMNTHKLDFYGSGVSNLICHDAMIKALRSGFNVSSHKYACEMLMQAKMSTEDNLAILISYTGQTSEIIKIANILKQNNVPSISITSNSSNPLSKLTNINLFVDKSETVYRVGGIESRVSIQTVLDILFTAYFSQSQSARENIEKTFTQEDFSLVNMNV